jgi:hypothetical protein
MLNDKERPEPQDAPYRVTLLLCRRTQRYVRPDEHEACPYCFGRSGEVEQGVYERFCDFKPGQDPVHFGFPDEDVRHSEG